MKKEYEVTVELDREFEDEHGAGNYIRETWTQDSVVHREIGPAVTIRHPITLVAVEEQFLKLGRHHRLGQPAIIQRDKTTGDVTNEYFFEQGKEIPASHVLDTPDPSPF